MPRKTKEINEEKNIEKKSKINKKIDTLINTVLDIEEPIVESKIAKTESTSKSKSSTAKTTKAKTSKSKETPKVSKNASKTKVEKASPKKTTKSKVEDKDKKSDTKSTKATKTAKKTTAKTTKKAATKKSTTSKTTKAKSSAASKTKAATKSKTKSKEVTTPTTVEYYDLPYKYNQTIVKVLYQNPTTLFVYWEISDNDIENYKNKYGDNFFETTRPVLVVYNDTMNYHFEVDINDFANSWYFNINDSKCDYRVELIRRPVLYNEKINSSSIHITSSNKVESPNDKILFSTDEPYTVYFRNTKNNKQRKVNLPKLLEQLNLTNKDFGFPIIRNVYDLYKNIYNIEDVGEFSVSLTNPSSGNPSSHTLASRSI